MKSDNKLSSFIPTLLIIDTMSSSYNKAEIIEKLGDICF